MFWIAYRAARGRLALTLLSTLGVALAVALAVSVPVFAQAVSHAIMREELDRRGEQLGRSPLFVRHYVLPTSQNPLPSARCLELAPHLAHMYQRNLNMGVRDVQVRVESGGLLLRSDSETTYGAGNTHLGTVSIGFLTGVDQHAEIVLGDPLGTPSQEDAVNVWMHEGWASEIGAQLGERFSALPIMQAFPVPVRVAGTWLPRDPDDPFWPVGGDSGLRTLLLVDPQTYRERVEPYLGLNPVGSVAWFVYLHETDFVPERAESYVRGLTRAEVELRQLVPGVRTDMTPQPILQAHLDRRRPLTILLLGFMVPIMGFLLYFLTLASRIVVEEQRSVMATMVSRGMSSKQVLQINLYQGLLIVALGTPLGILLGVQAARWMGHVSSFLEVTPRNPMQVSVHGANPALIVATMAVSLLARLWPSLRESRHGLIAHVARTVRLQKESILGRLHLELLLVLPTLYLYRQLRIQGSIALLGWHSTGDVFSDPALFLVPALFILTATLLAARLFPMLMWALDRTIAGLLGVVGCLTLRQLGRRSREYTSALALIMVSMSLGVFMASMALSLDEWLRDRVYYPLGADIVFTVEEPGIAGEDDLATGTSSVAGGSSTWLVPVESLTQIRGVEGATWIGRYRAAIPASASGTVRGWFLAIDRLTFAHAAVFRPDFAPEPLGALLNRLASRQNGVLVPEEFLNAHDLGIGDTLGITVSTDGATERAMEVAIVGVYRYFPTILDDQPLTLVGNLDYLLTSVGGVNSYDVWLRTDLALASESEIRHGLYDLVPQLTRYREVWSQMARELEAKERIGVYGTLTLGFLSALALSGIALLIQYQRSLRERMSRFATLRALGLARGELFAQVQIEYLVVLAAGLGMGALIGVWASQLFIPFFRVATPDGRLPIPPLVPQVDYARLVTMAIVFGALQILAQLAFIWRSLQAKVFQVLRMGFQE